MHDILIKNGLVIDGISKTAIKADIAIDDGKITQIESDLAAKPAREIVDATGCYVTPGFIDIQNHSDSYWTIFDQPDQRSLISQGITTAILGNCGASLAPLISPDAIKTIQKWHDLEGVNINWTSFEEFLAALERTPTSINVGSLVGHATLRRGLLKDQVRKVTPEELKVMDRLLGESLSQGALGLSMGLVYAHEVDSSLEELEVLARRLKAQNKYLSVHLRSEDGAILEALEEAITIARKCEVAVKISHLKIRGRENWHLFDRMINKLENAYHEGLNISFDVYPYQSSWSVLYTYLPKWAYEGGKDAILKRIAAPEHRSKILDYLKNQGHDYSNIRVATAESNPMLVGRPISHIAVNQGVSNEEALLNVLSACGTQVIVFDRNLSDEHVELLLSSPLSMVATDGAGYTREEHDLVHPRCFGTMPRFLAMVREKRILKWEQAIKKITSEPAKLLGLNARGVLKPEAVADVVVFDPQTVKDTADFLSPYQIAEGIKTVIVNGQLAFAEKTVRNLAGQTIKR
jgi:N-acyl-D-amino-acid deacylase